MPPQNPTVTYQLMTDRAATIIQQMEGCFQQMKSSMLHKLTTFQNLISVRIRIIHERENDVYIYLFSYLLAVSRRT